MARPIANAPRKTPRQARSKALVDAILEAAARVFVEEGFEAASTNRIAQAAGVSVGSLYQYFPSKDALLTAISQRSTDAMMALIQARLTEPGPASIGERVQRLMRAMIEVYSNDAPLQRVLVLEHARTGTHDRVRAAETTAADLVRALLTTTKTRSVANVDAAVFVIVHAVQGVTLSRAVRQPRGFDDDALATELSAMLMRYLGIEEEEA